MHKKSMEIVENPYIHTYQCTDIHMGTFIYMYFSKKTDKICLQDFRMTATWNSLYSAIFNGDHLFSQELMVII